MFVGKQNWTDTKFSKFSVVGMNLFWYSNVYNLWSANSFYQWPSGMANMKWVNICFVCPEYWDSSYPYFPSHSLSFICILHMKRELSQFDQSNPHLNSIFGFCKICRSYICCGTQMPTTKKEESHRLIVSI